MIPQKYATIRSRISRNDNKRNTFFAVLNTELPSTLPKIKIDLHFQCMTQNVHPSLQFNFVKKSSPCQLRSWDDIQVWILNVPKREVTRKITNRQWSLKLHQIAGHHFLTMMNIHVFYGKYWMKRKLSTVKLLCLNNLLLEYFLRADFSVCLLFSIDWTTSGVKSIKFTFFLCIGISSHVLFRCI